MGLRDATDIFRFLNEQKKGNLLDAITKNLNKGENETSDKYEKMKCPKNPKVEVMWKKEGALDWNFQIKAICSFSGHPTCKKCIKKGDYPKKNSV